MDSQNSTEANSMFIMLDTHVALVRQELDKKPLTEGEVRRVPRAGNLFMALRETEVPNEYNRLYNMAIDPYELSFYQR